MHFFHMDFFSNTYILMYWSKFFVHFVSASFYSVHASLRLLSVCKVLVLHHFTLTVLVTSPWPGFRCLFLFWVLNMPLSTATSMTMKTDGEKVKAT